MRVDLSHNYKEMSMFRVRVSLLLVAACASLVCLSADNVTAAPQGTTTDSLRIDVSDTLGTAGTTVPVSVFLNNLADSIQGFMISVTLSRPDLVEFTSDTTIDTCYVCLDSACTLLDTTICTVEVVPSTVVGTLVANWDYTAARTEGGTNIRLTGLADVDFNHSPLPILPWTNGVLMKVIARVLCDIPDTMTNRTVALQLNTVGTILTDPKGDTISNVKLINGSITVPPALKGDLDGNQTYNVIDVVKLINIAFRNYPPGCPPGVDDLNCDKVTNLQDVVLLVTTVFRNGPQPGC